MTTRAASLPANPKAQNTKWPGRLAWGLCAVAIGSSVLTLWLASASDNSRPLPESGSISVAFLAFAVVGAVVASRRPENSVGWLLIAVGAGAMSSNAAQQYATYSLESAEGSGPALQLVAWLGGWGWYAAMGCVLFALLLFPTGRLPSRRWRVVLAYDVATVAAVMATLMFAPGPIEGLSIQNPFGLTWLEGMFELIHSSAGFLLFGVLATSIAALIVRARGAEGRQRQQLKWLAFGGATFAVTVTGGGLLVSLLLGEAEGGDLAWALGLAAIPISMGVAILRHRLYDLTIVVNRSLVYLALTASVITLYIGLVTLFERGLDRSGQSGALVATGIVAVAFQPLRERLQRGVNRLMYGERDEPYAALSRLAQRLESTLPVEQTLGTVTESIATALRLPFAALELRRGDSFVPGASFGAPTTPTVTLGLTHRGEPVGRLLVAPRSPGEGFTAADRRLLEDLARQAGVAVYSAAVTMELRRSRTRLVTALEDERRRIRRDLHDGLGPTLAATIMELEAAGNLLERDPAAAKSLLDQLAGTTRGSLAEIRRLVYGLRPPALDELGLKGSLTEQASRLEGQESGLRLSLTTAGDLSRLSAAVEVAAYRIALEAMTNVVRHAHARACDVDLSVGDALIIEVTDDGVGLPEGARPGVGMASMRERCVELGGSFELVDRPEGGTALRAVLPLEPV